MVMAQSLFRLLQTEEPGMTIDVVGPPWSVPLVSRMPEVRRGIPLAVGHGELGLAARRALGRSLRGTGYNRAIVLPRSFKSALLPWFAGIPVRTGFAAEMRGLLLNDVRPLDRELLDQTVKRFLALGLPRGAPLPTPPPPALRVDAVNRRALLSRFGLGARPAIALMPGAAYGPAKQWPIDSFTALARLLVDQGLEVWVLGSAGEAAVGEQISAGTGAHVAQPLRPHHPGRLRRPAVGDPRCSDQRLRPDARCGRCRHACGGGLRQQFPAVHAATDVAQDDSLSGPRAAVRASSGSARWGT